LIRALGEETGNPIMAFVLVMIKELLLLLVLLLLLHRPSFSPSFEHTTECGMQARDTTECGMQAREAGQVTNPGGHGHEGRCAPRTCEIFWLTGGRWRRTYQRVATPKPQRRVRERDVYY